MEDTFSVLFGLIFCFIVIPLGIGLIGYRLGVRAAAKRHDTAHPAASPPVASRGATPEEESERVRWLLGELQREPMASTLTSHQRLDLRDAYRDRLTAGTLPADTGIYHEATATIAPSDPATGASAYKTAAAETEFTPSEPVITSRNREEQPREEPFREPVTHGRELDPAVMLLYVGALLVVAAAVIYAAYNWSDLSAWQKLGGLVAATLAFIAAGIGFRRNDRLAPAADTFLTIGALLVPTIAVAAWQVLDGANARPELALFCGAVATAITHGLFAIRPGGRLYDYGAVFSSVIAAATLPAVLGSDPRWGAPLALAVMAGFPVLTGPLNTLNRPRLLVSIVGTPIIAWTALSSAYSDGSDRWILPVTLAVATFALLRVPRFMPSARVVAEIGATLTAITTVPAAVHALNVLDVNEPRGWGMVALLTAIGWSVATLSVPRLRSMHVSIAMTMEAIAAYLAAYLLFTGDESHIFALAGVLTALVAMTLIAWKRQWDWLLFASAGFLLFGWSSAAFATDLDTASDLRKLQAAALYPVVTALGAIATGRWWHRSTRARAARRLWLVTLVSIAFVATAGAGIAFDDSATTLPVLLVLLTMAFVTLLGAAHLRSPGVLIGYGAIASTMTVLGVDRWVEGTMALPVTAVIATLGALGSVWLSVQSGSFRSGPLAIFSRPRPRLEALPLGVLAGFALVGVVANSIQEIEARFGQTPTRDLELTTEAWVAHLAVFALLLVASLGIGRRFGAAITLQPGNQLVVAGYRLLVWLPLPTALLIAAGVTSLVTRDPLRASHVAMAVAGIVASLGIAWRSDDTFLDDVRSSFTLAWPILLAVAVLWNLDLASRNLVDGELLVQIGVYGVLAVVFGFIAARTRSRNIIYVAATLLALGGWFGIQYLDVRETAALMAFIVTAWITAGVAVVAHGRSRSTWATVPLIGSSLGISVASLAFAVPRLDDLFESDRAHLLNLFVIWLMSLAGLLALASWLLRHQELARLGTIPAMAALLLQIDARSPENIHAYTVPVAAWFFALGLLERHHSSRASGLFGASAAVLVVPGLAMAQTSGDFRWLAIVLLEGIAFFISGLILRLRVPIAAGVITLSVLVLRMAVDVVNALPNWVALLVAGLILLVGGTIWISFRDEMKDRLDGIRTRLGPLE
jgi:hypothetical protein